jgi:hypothetical protein
MVQCRCYGGREKEVDVSGWVMQDHAVVVWLVPRPRGAPPPPRPRFWNPPRPRWFMPPRPPVYPFPPYAPALGRRGST